MLERLERHALSGWSVVHDVSGAGELGRQHADEITGVSSNHSILITVPPGQQDALPAELRGLLASHGGMCLVCDASWLRH